MTSREARTAIRAGSMVPTDEYAPTAIGVGPAVVRDLCARRYAPMSAHAAMMLDHDSARDAWLAARESYATGYATEEREFAQAYPRTTLKDWMTR